MANLNPNIISDVATYTKLPGKVFDELISKFNLCVGSAISDALQAKAEAVVLNIGIGTLSVNLADMQCKFIPSKDLKATIKECIANPALSPVETELEKIMVQKLLAICEETI